MALTSGQKCVMSVYVCVHMCVHVCVCMYVCVCARAEIIVNGDPLSPLLFHFYKDPLKSSRGLASFSAGKMGRN